MIKRKPAQVIWKAKQTNGAKIPNKMKGDGRAQRAAARGEVGGDHAKDCCGQDDPWRRCPHDGGVIMQKAKNDRRDHDPDKSVQAQALPIGFANIRERPTPLH